MPIVYIDVLFLVNLIINFVLLTAAECLSKVKTSFWRTFIGALIGAVYAVCIFFPSLSVLYSVIAKILVSMLIVTAAFKIYTVRSFIKTLACFYLVSFGFGGGALAIFYFTNIGAKVGAVLSNGVFYFNLPWKVLLLSTLICYIMIQIMSFIIKRSITKDQLKKALYITLSGKTVYMTALFDTGNSLYDPISNNPVIVAEYEKLREILPDGAKMLFDKMDETEIASRAEDLSECELKIRIIPFSSLGREKGVLLGFKPDEAVIFDNGEKKELGECIVCIYNRSLSNDKSYNALLGPNIIQ